MGTRKQRKATASSGYVCRSCKQPVRAVVKRHKTMGVFVPVWTAGPCRNPLCLEYAYERTLVDSARRGPWSQPTGREGD